jgi:ABC-type antimicrobial peptide transport system permease subunit
VLAIALGFMLISGVVAAWIPSRRATRLQPAQLLRSA